MELEKLRAHDQREIKQLLHDHPLSFRLDQRTGSCHRRRLASAIQRVSHSRFAAGINLTLPGSMDSLMPQQSRKS